MARRCSTNVFGHISLPDEEEEADAAARLIQLLLNAGVDPFAVDDQGRGAMYLFRQLHVNGLEHLEPPALDDAAFLEALSLGKITEAIRLHILKPQTALRAEYFEVAVRAAAQDPECRDPWLTPMLIRQLVTLTFQSPTRRSRSRRSTMSWAFWPTWRTRNRTRNVSWAPSPFMLVAERHQRLATMLIEQAALECG